MRAIGQIPHQIAAKAILAGAALLASASVVVTRAHAKPPEAGPEPYSEELAMVLPRQAFPEGDDVTLPKPLPPEVATQVRAILRLQQQGAFTEAISSTTHLTDATLLGELQADRYLNPNYHPNATELRNWLKQYTSYADAPAIWARLAALPERGGPLPPAPPADHLAPAHAALAAGPLAQEFTRNPLLDRTLRERTTWGLKGVHSALHLISITPGMTPAYAAQLQAETAQAMLVSGETDMALDIGRTAVNISRERNALASYITGLALWQKQAYAEAIPFLKKPPTPRAPCRKCGPPAPSGLHGGTKKPAMPMPSTSGSSMRRLFRAVSMGFWPIVCCGQTRQTMRPPAPIRTLLALNRWKTAPFQITAHPPPRC